MKKIFFTLTILLTLIFNSKNVFSSTNGLIYLTPPKPNALVEFDRKQAVVLFTNADGVDLLEGEANVNNANLYPFLNLDFESPGAILATPSKDNYLINYSISLNLISGNNQDTTSTGTLYASIAYIQDKFEKFTQVGSQSATVNVGEVLNLSNQYLVTGLDPNKPTLFYLVIYPEYSDIDVSFSLTSFSPCGKDCEKNAPFSLGIESVSQ